MFYGYGPGLGPYVAANFTTNFTVISTNVLGIPQDSNLNGSVPLTRIGTGMYSGQYTPTSLGSSSITIFAGAVPARVYDIEVYGTFSLYRSLIVHKMTLIKPFHPLSRAKVGVIRSLAHSTGTCSPYRATRSICSLKSVIL